MNCPDSSNYDFYFNNCETFQMSFVTDPAVIIVDRKYVLSNTTEEWNETPELVSKENYIYVYTDYKTTLIDGNEVDVPGLKIGDGETLLIDLPFVDAYIENQMELYMVKGVDYVTAGQLSGSTLGSQATAEGNNTTASGQGSHAEGLNSIASGLYAHAEGVSTTSSGAGSHAEGGSSTASANQAHAEGYNTTASSANAHAENYKTTASGEHSHAEGYETTASGFASHSEGWGSTVSGNYSHGEGDHTIAQRKLQHVFGAYNIADTEGSSASYKGTYVEIVGNGTADNARSNARTLDWSGNEILKGKLTIGAAPTGDMDVTNKTYVDDLVTPIQEKIPDEASAENQLADKSYVNSQIAAGNFMVKGVDYVTAGRKSGTIIGTSATAEGIDTQASSQAAHAEGYNTKASNYYTHAEGNGTQATVASAHAEGSSTIASGNSAHAEGNTTTASAGAAHAEGNTTTASATAAHAEGYQSQATKDYAHAEGRQTTASGNASHAEGYLTTASGAQAHAEGHDTTASGEMTHAEGISSVASGYYSHAQGSGTIAQRRNQFTFGSYNIADTTGADVNNTGAYIEIVGNGSGNSSRSNARTLDWSGNEVLAGKLTIGVNPTGDMDVTSKTYVDTALALKANLASPTFTGTPKAPTPTTGDNSTNIATTAFVQNTITARLVSLADTNTMLNSVFGVA